MHRFLRGILAVAILAPAAGAQDRSKKAYELMYEDIQLLKLQTERIEKKLDRAADDLKTLSALVSDLAGQFRDYQKFQARNQEGWSEVPDRVRSLQEQMSQIESRLMQLAEDIQALKAPAVPPETETPGTKPEPGEKRASSPKTPAPKTSTEPAVKIAPPSGQSPQEVFQAAIADYSKGNLELAEDGFSLYRELDPESPRADNALYMMGECRYGRKKFSAAIEAFDDVILNYPMSDKIASAYLKKGFALAGMKKKAEAVAALRLLLSKYPLEEEAKQAQQKIKELQEKTP